MSEMLWKVADGDLFVRFIIGQDMRFQAAMRNELVALAEDKGLRLRPKANPEKERKSHDILDIYPTITDTAEPRHRVVLREVAQKHSTTITAIVGVRRDREAAAARHEAMWRMREDGMSLAAIGRRVNRDHTTVLSGIRKHKKRLEEIRMAELTEALSQTQ